MICLLCFAIKQMKPPVLVSGVQKCGECFVNLISCFGTGWGWYANLQNKNVARLFFFFFQLSITLDFFLFVSWSILKSQVRSFDMDSCFMLHSFYWSLLWM